MPSELAVSSHQENHFKVIVIYRKPPDTLLSHVDRLTVLEQPIAM